jgi:glycine cleavage system H protein
MYNDDMRFAATHEWLRVDNNNIAEVGISGHAQEMLGDIVYIELPKVGHQIKYHEVFGTVESVKSASDLYAPVSGEIVEVNEKVVANPALINSSPHNDGWLLKIKITDTNELNSLMTVSEYEKSIAG